MVGRDVWINKTVVGSIVYQVLTALCLWAFIVACNRFLFGSCFAAIVLCILKIWGLKLFFFWDSVVGVLVSGFGVQGFGFCPLLFHGVKCFGEIGCFGGGASLLLLSLSLSLSLSAFYFHVFVFALPTAVGNRLLFVFFPFRLGSCYAFRLFVCGCQAFSLDARIFVRERVEIISM